MRFMVIPGIMLVILAYIAGSVLFTVNPWLGMITDVVIAFTGGWIGMSGWLHHRRYMKIKRNAEYGK